MATNIVMETNLAVKQYNFFIKLIKKFCPIDEESFIYSPYPEGIGISKKDGLYCLYCFNGQCFYNVKVLFAYFLNFYLENRKIIISRKNLYNFKVSTMRINVDLCEFL